MRNLTRAPVILYILRLVKNIIRHSKTCQGVFGHIAIAVVTIGTIAIPLFCALIANIFESVGLIVFVRRTLPVQRKNVAVFVIGHLFGEPRYGPVQRIVVAGVEIGALQPSQIIVGVSVGVVIAQGRTIDLLVLPFPFGDVPRIGCGDPIATRIEVP